MATPSAIAPAMQPAAVVDQVGPRRLGAVAPRFVERVRDETRQFGA